MKNNIKLNDVEVSPSVAYDANGNFVIAWQDYSNNNDIKAQRFTNIGTAIGGIFKVNDDIGSADQYFPSVASDSSGNFVIVWTDARNYHLDIYAQRYSNDGKAVGSNFKVNNAKGK